MVASKSLNITFKATDRVSAVIDKMNESIKRNNMALFRLNKQYKDFKKSTSRVFNKLGKNNLFGTLGNDILSLRDKLSLGIKPWHLWAGAIGIAYGAFRLFRKAIEEGLNRDNIVAGFMPFTGGDKGKANKLADRVQSVSIQTTFKSTDIADNVKSLALAMGGDMNKAFATFNMLANTSQGSLEKLQRQVNGYTKALLINKLNQESMKILAETQIPIYDALAEAMFGASNATNKSKVMDALGQKGGADLKYLEKAFEILTKKGGIFYDAQSFKAKSAAGQFEALGESINLAFGEIGGVMLEALQPLMPILFEAVQGLREWINANKELIKTKFAAFVDKMSKGLKEIFKYFSEHKEEILNKILLAFDLIGSAILFIVQHKDAIITIVTWWIKLQIALTIIAPVLQVINFAMNAIYMSMVYFGISALAASGYVGLIIAGLTIVSLAVYTIYKNWEKIKQNIFVISATVAMLFSPVLAPLALIGIIVHEIWQYWDKIQESFITGGIIGGFLKLGEIILSAILLPIQKVLTMLYEMTGFEFIKNARDAIFQTRMDLIGTEQGRNYVQPLLPVDAQKAQDHKLSVTLWGKDPYEMAVNPEGTSKGVEVKTAKTR